MTGVSLNSLFSSDKEYKPFAAKILEIQERYDPERHVFIITYFQLVCISS